MVKRITDKGGASGSSQEMERLRLLVKNIESFCSLYDFLSQIIPFGDSELEKRYIFFRHILPLLREELRTKPWVCDIASRIA